MFWPPSFFKQNVRNANVFMFSYFEPNFIYKFLWKCGFSNFGYEVFFVKRIIVFWSPFWNRTFFPWLMVVLGVYRYCASFVPQFLRETGGGHSHCGGDADVRLQRPPMFSAAVTQWPHIFADCLCCHPKTHIFWWNVGSSSLSPKDPIFFAFGCHSKLLFVSILSTY